MSKKKQTNKTDIRIGIKVEDVKAGELGVGILVNNIALGAKTEGMYTVSSKKIEFVQCLNDTDLEIGVRQIVGILRGIAKYTQDGNNDSSKS